ncbi:MAG: branched-chain amino acid ABC transporter substrate-binding protein [Candidatus Sericytochromatia bacterium]|nr:branched-chain amino acid ABC transporter substrate-binding protein [Candidatus Sericytochromatia bacterium]
MRRVTAWSLLLCLAALHAQPADAASAAYKLGVAAPLTGPLAKMGADIRQGVQLAVDEVNAGGGFRGQKVELVVGDDKGDPREGMVVASKLVQSGVLGVVGHLNSGISIPASKEVYAPASVAMVTPASTNPQLTERGLRNVFRTIGRDDQQGKDAAAHVLARGIRKVAVLDNKNAYGQGLADVFRRTFVAGGGEIVLSDSVTSGDKDFTPTLTRIKARRPELLFFGGEYQDAGLLARQARRVGIRVPVMGGDGILDGTFVTLAGQKAAEGTLATGPGGSSQKGFKVVYTKRFGEPGAYSAYAYDAAHVLMAAMARAGKADRKAVLAAVASTRNHPGATGKITFDRKGDQPNFKFSVWTVQDGRFQLLP